jgi:CHASE1-domain containing sensor protein
LALLLVPLLLGVYAAGLTAWFNEQQDARQNRFETKRDQQAQKVDAISSRTPS